MKGKMVFPLGRFKDVKKLIYKHYVDKTNVPFFVKYGTNNLRLVNIVTYSTEISGYILDDIFSAFVIDDNEWIYFIGDETDIDTEHRPKSNRRRLTEMKLGHTSVW